MRSAAWHDVCRRAGLGWERICVDRLPRIVGHGGVMNVWSISAGQAEFAIDICARSLSGAAE